MPIMVVKISMGSYAGFRSWPLVIKGKRLEVGGWRLKIRMFKPQTSNLYPLLTSNKKPLTEV